jgi:hypothetical protein
MCIEKDGTFHPDTITRTEDVFVELCKKFNLDPMCDIVRHFDVTAKIVLLLGLKMNNNSLNLNKELMLN